MTKILASVLLVGALFAGSAGAAFAASHPYAGQGVSQSDEYINVWSQRNRDETR